MPAASNVAVMLVPHIWWHRVCDEYNLFLWRRSLREALSSHAAVQNHNLTQSDADKCSPVARRCAELWDHVVLLELVNRELQI